MRTILYFVLCSLALLSAGTLQAAEKYQLRTFETRQLEKFFLAEGATYGDVNKDGKADIIAGNFWYAGPDFDVAKRRAFYKPNTKKRPYPADVNGYSDNFFAFVDDLNHDGWNDIIVIQFPGEETVWYENPKGDKVGGLWIPHKIFDVTDNESPTYTDLTGDGKKELVCQTDGSFGYAGPDAEHPEKPWKFHAISKKNPHLGKFTHGLGVGDVNGDGRMDILYREGWYEQPESLKDDLEWKFHTHPFAHGDEMGGAQMYVYDVDGDGLNDIITSLSAHGHGLSWFRQLPGDKKEPTFEEHKILASKASDNPYGVVFGELHALDFIDMNGDGLKDIVTGKRWWSHGARGDHDENKSPYLYWFELVRKAKGEVEWVPHMIHDESGVGTQVVAGDFTGDGNPDVVVSNKRGTFIHIQKVAEVSKDEFEKNQPVKSDENAQPAKEIEKNGLSPKKAAEAMTVPKGFKVQLFAGEPDVKQPIAMCFDHRGRLWVAECYTYPIRQPEGQGKDRILIFEDTDGDGKFDKSTVFIEKLNLLCGMEVGFGGVWVGAAPYLMFIPDADGDDKPDSQPVVLLDGWGYGDTHETLNSFNWGPDGWLYGCHGVFTESLVGKPGTPRDQRTHINAGIWRYHPTEHKFERFIEGTSNPWGVDFNDRGHAFLTACVIPHLYHLQQGGRFLRQGGFHDNIYTFDDIDTIAKHRHWVGNKGPHAGNKISDSAGGGHAHSGAMFYLGGAWPDRFKDKLFMNNIHGSRLNMDNITRHGDEGASYEGNFAPDFCYANDICSQLLYLTYGPDGQVTMIDWYDEQQCHDQRHPAIHDRSNGRIFKIVYGNPEPVKAFDLTKKSDLELAKLTLDKNDWYVRHARRVLQERAAKGKIADDAVKYLTAQIKEQKETPRRLRFIWALKAVVGSGADELWSTTLDLLNDQDADVRSWVIQLLAEDRKVDAKDVAKFADMAKNDRGAIVRAYLASAMQRMPLADCWGIAEALSQHSEDVGDHNLPLMYWYGIEPLVMNNPERAMALALNCKLPVVAKYIVRRAAAEEPAYEALIAGITKSNEKTQLWILEEVVNMFKTRANMKMPAAWTQCYEKLAVSKNKKIKEQAEYIAVKFGDVRVVPQLRKTLVDKNAPIGSRIAALDSLKAAKDGELPKFLYQCLDEEKLRLLAINALGAYDDKETPAALIASYAKWSDAEKQAAISTLSSRPKYILELLDAIEAKKVPRADLSAFTVRQIATMKDNKLVMKRLNEVWGQVTETTKDLEEEMRKYKRLIVNDKAKENANLPHGRELFNNMCGKCHKLHGLGMEIGPELTGSNRGNIDYLLLNILAPSAEVGKDYRTTIVETDGRTVQGLLKDENDSAITLQTPTNLEKIDKKDIDDRHLSNLSIMPEGQLKTLKDNQEIIDLFYYLMNPAQVPLPGEAPVLDKATGKVSAAFEGENLKPNKNPPGGWAQQEMGGFKEGKWSNSAQGWWRGGQVNSRLELAVLDVKAGRQEVFVGLTKAHDYAIVKLQWNDGPWSAPIDLFDNNVTNTAPISLGTYDCKNGKNILRVEIVGSNPDADNGFMFGLDYVSLLPRTEAKPEKEQAAK